jgi:uncharacterized protein YndB with AHSA1/START domain
MTETPPSDIEITRHLDVQHERVYHGFTDPDEFAEWYGPVGFPDPPRDIEAAPFHAEETFQRGA